MTKNAVELRILGTSLRVHCPDQHFLTRLTTRYYYCSGHDLIQPMLDVFFEPIAGGYRVTFEGRQCDVQDAPVWPQPYRIVDMLVERTRPDLLFLHASSVLFANKAALFVGPSMSGKSTVARTVASNKHPVVADDTTPVSLETGEALAYCTVPDGQTPSGRDHAVLGSGAGFAVGWVFFISQQDRFDQGLTRSMGHNLQEYLKMLRLCWGASDLHMSIPEKPIAVWRGESTFYRSPCLTRGSSVESVRRLLRFSHPHSVCLGRRLAWAMRFLSKAEVLYLSPGYADQTASLIKDTVLESCPTADK